MQLVMDADALIKLTRCGAKEAVVDAFEVVIPPTVRHEAAQEQFPDGAAIAANLAAGRIRVVTASGGPSELGILPPGGEREVYVLGVSHPHARIVSDDRKFTRRLAMLGLTAQTPATVLVALRVRGWASQQEVIGWLEALRPLVSREEYAAARGELAAGGQ